MDFSLLPTDSLFPSQPSPPADPWLRPSTAPSLLPEIPPEILHKIASYLPHSSSHPTRLSTPTLLALSSTCSFLHTFLLNSIYSTLTIPSPTSLTTLTSHLSAHTWPGHSTAITTLTLHWPSHPHTSTPTSRHNLSKSITLSLRILLESHTDALQTLTLSFPGAGICLQSAILHHQVHQKLHLKHLTITNSLCPQYQPAPFLLCAISTLCAASLEELVLDGRGAEGEGGTEMHVPGRNMFCDYETLGRLRMLHVRGLRGFTEGCLSWLLRGETVEEVVLEENPQLTRAAIEMVLGGGSGWNVTVRQTEGVYVEPLQGGCSSVASPRSWWELVSEDCEDGSGAAVSFVYDAGSGSGYSDSMSYRGLHICDIARASCRSFKRLDIPASAHLLFDPFRCSPTPVFSDKDAEYVGGNLASGMLPTPPASPSLSGGAGAVKLRGGEVKRVYRVADGVLERGVVKGFVRLGGLWGGCGSGKGWFNRK